MLILAFLLLGLAVVLVSAYVLPQANNTNSKNSHDTKSFQTLKLNAQENPEAQFDLAWAYANGIGTEQSWEKAAEWLQSAASQKHPKAQHLLAHYYYSGNGLEQDYALAFQWFYEAAEQGLAEAQFMTGRMLFEGTGVKANQDEAFKWLYLADDQGLADAAILIRTYQKAFLSERNEPELLLLAQSGDHKSLTSLVQNGADINMRDSLGRTALMHAVKAGEVSSLLHLIESGANLNIQANDGWTALMYAAQSNLGAVAVLLEHGAFQDLRNQNGQSAYDIALQSHAEPLISLRSATSRSAPNN